MIIGFISNKIKYFYITAFLLVLSRNININAHSESFYFKHIDISNGLSQNSVQSIIEDDFGFIWFGTSDGLNRYDANEIKVFRHSEEENSICSNNIFRMTKDKNGNLWIATNHGLSLLDHETEQFRNFYQNSENVNSLASNKVQDFAFQGDSILWIATDDGLNKLHLDNFVFETFRKQSGTNNTLLKNDIMALEIQGDSILWIGTFGEGLSKLDLRTWQFTHFTNDPLNSSSLPNNYIRDMFADSNNLLWVGTEHGLARFDYNTQNLKIFDQTTGVRTNLSNDWIMKIWEDPEGHIWIGTDGGGINILDPKTNTVNNIRNSRSAFSLSDDRIWEIYQDSNGLIWIGTWSNGANMLNPFSGMFKTYSHNAQDINSLSDNRVFAFAQDENKLFIGTLGGLNIMNLNDNKFSLFRFPDSPTYGDGLNFIFAIDKSKDNILWMGSREGLIKFNSKTYQYKVYRNNPGKPGSLNYNNIWSVLSDGDKVWVGTAGGGLDEFNMKEEVFYHHVVDNDKANSISDNAITDIKKDKDGILWIATESGGINIFDQNSRKFLTLKNNPYNKNSLSINNTKKILLSSDSCFYIATAEGLNEYNIKTHSFKTYTQKDGLPNNVIYSLVRDNNGNVWMGTNKGLSKFNPVNKTFTNYTKEDGLQSDEFNQGAGYKLKDGRLVFGGINGINIFEPNQITNNSIVPNVYITDFQIYNHSVLPGQKVDGQVILTKPIHNTKEIELSHYQKVIGFKFTALNYIIPAGNQYAYKLEGFDDDWNNIGNRRFAMYTNLLPGEYTLKVKGSNNDGQWNNYPTTIKIIISLPYWRSYWFIFLVGFAFFLLVYAFHKLKLRQMHNQQYFLEHEIEIRTRELKEANAKRDRFFSVLAHDLRGPFNTILGNTQLLHAELDKLSKSDIKLLAKDLNLSLEQLYNLLENLLEWANLQLNKIDYSPVNISIKNLIDDNYRLLRKNLEKKQIEFIRNIPSEAQIFADKHMINSVFQNLLTNSIKFTKPGGRISVYTDIVNNVVNTKIIDSGVGIPRDRLYNIFSVDSSFTTMGTANEKGSGLGLVLCHEFVSKNKGTIAVESKEGEGTTFTVSFPAL